MRATIFTIGLLATVSSHADNLQSYMSIANNIPKMELKADAQAQIWARSARNVLAVTNETVAETIQQANDIASKQGKPLFCLPQPQKLDSAIIDKLLQERWQENEKNKSDSSKISISEAAWQGVLQRFPCSSQASKSMG